MRLKKPDVKCNRRMLKWFWSAGITFFCKKKKEKKNIYIYLNLLTTSTEKAKKAKLNPKGLSSHSSAAFTAPAASLVTATYSTGIIMYILYKPCIPKPDMTSHCCDRPLMMKEQQVAMFALTPVEVYRLGQIWGNSKIWQTSFRGGGDNKEGEILHLPVGGWVGAISNDWEMNEDRRHSMVGTPN